MRAAAAQQLEFFFLSFFPAALRTVLLVLVLLLLLLLIHSQCKYSRSLVIKRRVPSNKRRLSATVGRSGTPVLATHHIFQS